MLAAVRVRGDVSLLIFSEIGRRFDPWAVLFFVNAFIALTSLVPLTTRSIVTGAIVGSDGHKILHLPFLPDEQRQAHVDAYPLLEGSVLLHMGRSEEALACARASLAKDPERVMAKVQVAEALINLRRYEAARAGYVEVLQHPDLAAMRPLLRNNAAWAIVMLGREELLAEADVLSADALRGGSGNPAIMGTRGSVLAQMGRIDEATPLLQRAFTRNDTPRNRASNACFLAMIEARRGSLGSARRWVDTAARLDPTCDLLDPARASLVEPGTTGPLFTLS